MQRHSPPPARQTTVAAALLTIAGDRPAITTSAPELAELTGYAVRTVQLAIEEAANAGALTVTYPAKGSMYVELHRTHVLWPLARVLQQVTA